MRPQHRAPSRDGVVDRAIRRSAPAEGSHTRRVESVERDASRGDTSERERGATLVWSAVDQLLDAPCTRDVRRSRALARVKLRRNAQRVTPEDLPCSAQERMALGALYVRAYAWFLTYFSARRWVERGKAGIHVEYEDAELPPQADFVPDAAWRATEKLALRILSAKDASVTPSGARWLVRSAVGYLAQVGQSAGTDLFRGWRSALRMERVLAVRADTFAAPVDDPCETDDRRLAAHCYHEVLARVSRRREREAVWCWFAITLHPPVDLAVQAVAHQLQCSVRTVYRRLALGESLVRGWGASNPFWHEMALAALRLIDHGADYRSLVALVRTREVVELHEGSGGGDSSPNLSDAD